MQDSKVSPLVENPVKEYAKFSLVIVIILVGAWLLSDGSWMDAMRWFMGLFFAVFGMFKLVNLKMFMHGFSEYDIVAKRSALYARAYPFIELILAGLYIFNYVPVARNAITLTIMLVGAIGIAQELMNKSKLRCACLGNVINLPLTTVSLSENTLMGAMAITALISLI